MRYDRLRPHHDREEASKEAQAKVHAISSSHLFFSEKKPPTSWTPMSLRPIFLLTMLLVTLGLAVLLQVLLLHSQSNKGLYFVSSISDLSRLRSFSYLYLPTTIAVTYSLMWNWIELDTKRTEPFRQLSRPGGATAKDSVLLQYPFDFVATVAINALRRRHWPVFVASTTLLLVSWGMIPLQATIFATDTVTKSSESQMLVSNKHLTLSEQQSELTVNCTYSAFNIAFLNERLPPYMSRDAALVPFQPQRMQREQDNETWTTNTTLYIVDVECEAPVTKSINGTAFYTGWTGCSIPILGWGPPDNYTSIYNDSKEYVGFYAGNGDNSTDIAEWADYYTSQYCPANASHVFFVALAHAQAGGTVTRLFCNPTYYQQEVSATVTRTELGVTNVEAVGEKKAFPDYLFNITNLEVQMCTAYQILNVRGDIPATQWPDQTSVLSGYPLDYWGDVDEAVMVGMAIGADQRPMEEYMNASVLAQSYQAAYRLLFSRAMMDVLQPDFLNATSNDGVTTYTIQAVYMVAGFSYAVEVLLIIVAILTMLLYYLLSRQPLALLEDPSSIAAQMRLASEDDILLRTFSLLDVSDDRSLEELLAKQRFALRETQHGYRLQQSPDGPLPKDTNRPSQVRESSTRKRNLRREPSAWVLLFGTAFTSVLGALIAFVGFLYRTGLTNGLPLSSQNHFVRQLVESYVPTAIATLIEPTWVFMNRRLCVLQPFDALIKGNAPASDSINLQYTSHPPQLMLLRAVRNRQFGLTLACMMALLANVLTVAFSGMFNEGSATVPEAMNFTNVYEPMFLPVDGPNADTAGDLKLFYIAMSNLTSNTPLPAWTDDVAFYMPVELPSSRNTSQQFMVETRAFGTEVECRQLRQGSQNTFVLTAQSDGNGKFFGNLTFSITDATFGNFRCVLPLGNETGVMAGDCPAAPSSLEVIGPVYSPDEGATDPQSMCSQMLVAAWFRSASFEQCGTARNMTRPQAANVTDKDATVLACLPLLTSQLVNVTVNDYGLLIQEGSAAKVETEVQKYFIGNSTNLTLLANDILTNKETTWHTPLGISDWHQDTYPSDWMSYVMEHASGGNDFLNPAFPPPTFEVIAPLFSNAYSRLFAIWLSTKQNSLFARSKSAVPTTGTVLQKQPRVMVSRLAFIVAETILAAYVLTLVYVFVSRRHWTLPSSPTTMGSMIVTFAASRAVREIDHGPKTSTGKGNSRFGYGTYMGTDHREHVGIERDPFVSSIANQKSEECATSRVTWRRLISRSGGRGTQLEARGSDATLELDSWGRPK